MNTEDEFLKTDEAAVVVRRSPSTLAKLRLSGGGPEFFKQGKVVLYPRSGLIRWLTERRFRSTSEYDREVR